MVLWIVFTTELPSKQPFPQSEKSKRVTLLEFLLLRLSLYARVCACVHACVRVCVYMHSYLRVPVHTYRKLCNNPCCVKRNGCIMASFHIGIWIVCSGRYASKIRSLLSPSGRYLLIVVDYPIEEYRTYHSLHLDTPSSYLVPFLLLFCEFSAIFTTWFQWGQCVCVTVHTNLKPVDLCIELNGYM